MSSFIKFSILLSLLFRGLYGKSQEVTEPPMYVSDYSRISEMVNSFSPLFLYLKFSEESDRSKDDGNKAPGKEMVDSAQHILNKIKRADSNQPKVAYDFYQSKITYAKRVDTLSHKNDMLKIFNSRYKYKYDSKKEYGYDYNDLSTFQLMERVVHIVLDIYLERNNYDSAKAAYSYLIDISTDMVETLHDIGWSQYSFGRYVESIRSFRLANDRFKELSEERKPYNYSEYLSNHFGLAKSYNELKEYGKAESFYLFYVDNFDKYDSWHENKYESSTFRKVMYQLASYDYLTGKENNAIARLTDVIDNYDDPYNLSIYPTKEVFYFLRGICLCAEERYIEGLRDLNNYESMNSDSNSDTYFLTKRSNCKKGAGDMYGALKDINTAITLEPEVLWHLYNRALLKHDIGDYYGAIKDYTAALQEESDQETKAQYLNMRGFSYLYLDDKANACKDWSEAGSLGDLSAYELISKFCK